MNLYLASDHAAYELKQHVLAFLKTNFQEYKTIDLGTDSTDSTHYPKYGKKIAEAILKDSNSIGIAMCGSGIGISIQVNRYKGIRGALCNDEYDAKMCKQHNNANILCLAGRKHTHETIESMISLWLKTEFEGGRHLDRVKMLDN